MATIDKDTSFVSGLQIEAKQNTLVKTHRGRGLFVAYPKVIDYTQPQLVWEIFALRILENQEEQIL
jgi:hypothetical protein